MVYRGSFGENYGNLHILFKIKILLILYRMIPTILLKRLKNVLETVDHHTKIININFFKNSRRYEDIKRQNR